ncbi:M10 family metallopeptidase C-terminal domain-containing protein [Cereibacter sphaeroides]|uniref:calcium-binding protein n=1 Tax=Cereibacter sphaeroides TaxID=1063 RepID=UPI001F1E7F11|nr:calcium-binding protein [Cereibacter sphaeroides]MCE6951340.1 M10 family metallopeptidase C-terminal domain-containing protein [Cereibacter sphaeroides]
MYRIATATSGDDRIGSVIGDHHFGVNFLFDRDRLDAGDSYLRAVNDLGISTIRYPGGTIAERMFDLADPDGTLQNHAYGDRTRMFDPDGSGPLQGSTLGLWSALSAAGAAGLSLSFVMPTIRFAGTYRDAAGNRYEAVDADLVRAFTQEFLARALAAGVDIPAIELGNEWWADNSDVFGENLSAVEYGRIASRLAMVIQGAIDDFRATNDLPRDWVEPEILVQVGPGGRAEQVLPNGEPVPEGYTGPTVSATQLIFAEFNLAAEQRAMDGLLTHRYLTGTSVDGWAYNPFAAWDRMADGNANFGDLSRYVTEWNVSARNDDISGLKMAPWLVAMFAEAVQAGVDHANVWSVQQNNATRLSTTTGLAGETYRGLTVAGETLRIMNEQLVGLQSLNLRDMPETMMVEAFGSGSKTVLFISNMTGQSMNGEFDVSDIAAGYQHVWASSLGVASGDPLAADAVARIGFLAAVDLMSGNLLSVSLDAYETLCIEFTLDRSGVRINGRSLDDRLSGSAAGDALAGGSGNDRIDGSAGADSIRGGSGVDRLFGGLGADVLAGEDGNDVASGGSGADILRGGRGNDYLRGDAGNDRLAGNSGRDYLSGGSGADTFVFGSTADSRPGTARDTITDFTPGTDTIQLSGIDANVHLAGNQAFRFIGAASFTEVAGQLRCVARNGGRLIEGDIDGDGVAELQIFLEDAVTVRAGDFLL